MEDFRPITLGLAALWGGLHALIPCAHSWPMLVPFVGPERRPRRPVLFFGLGQLVACVGAGAIIGSAVGGIPQAWQLHAEEVTGVLLILLGLVMGFGPRAGHLGHVHGDCLPDADPHCAHPAHQPARFASLGPGVGLFLLGACNAAIPCWTNLSALGLALSAGGVLPSMLVLATFGLAAAGTMGLILALVRRGLGVLDRLSSGRVETLLLRVSGALLVVFGLSLVLHWHEH